MGSPRCHSDGPRRHQRRHETPSRSPTAAATDPRTAARGCRGRCRAQRPASCRFVRGKLRPAHSRVDPRRAGGVVRLVRTVAALLERAIQLFGSVDEVMSSIYGAALPAAAVGAFSEDVAIAAQEGTRCHAGSGATLSRSAPARSGQVANTPTARPFIAQRVCDGGRPDGAAAPGQPDRGALRRRGRHRAGDAPRPVAAGADRSPRGWPPRRGGSLTGPKCGSRTVEACSPPRPGCSPPSARELRTGSTMPHGLDGTRPPGSGARSRAGHRLPARRWLLSALGRLGAVCLKLFACALRAATTDLRQAPPARQPLLPRRRNTTVHVRLHGDARATVGAPRHRRAGHSERSPTDRRWSVIGPSLDTPNGTP
jgi:hypothetical protein